MEIAFVGFGEAGRTFAAGLGLGGAALLQAFDAKTCDPETREAIVEATRALGVRNCAGAQEALATAGLVLSVVTPDQALAAAEQAGRFLPPGCLFCDMNSAAPDTKRSARDAIERGGGRYVDVAIMAPVEPGGLSVPMLASGVHAPAAVELLRRLGFSVSIIDGDVGAASAIKMIRSIMVKGLEALTAECLLSAHVAGVEEAVIASLESSSGNSHWRDQADYNLGRMLVHGRRRAAEMEESSRTAAALGMHGAMAAAAADWQRRIGAVLTGPSPTGLSAKLARIAAHFGAARP